MSSADADLVTLLPDGFLQDFDPRSAQMSNTLAACDSELAGSRADRKHRASGLGQHTTSCRPPSARCFRKRGRHHAPPKHGFRRYWQDPVWAVAAASHGVREPARGAMAQAPREPQVRQTWRRRAAPGGDLDAADPASPAEERRVRFASVEVVEVGAGEEIEDWPKAWVTHAVCDACGELLPRYEPADQEERWVRLVASPWYDIGGCPCKVPCLVCTSCSVALETARGASDQRRKRWRAPSLPGAAPAAGARPSIEVFARKDGSLVSAVLSWAPICVVLAETLLLLVVSSQFMLNGEGGSFLSTS